MNMVWVNINITEIRNAIICSD